MDPDRLYDTLGYEHREVGAGENIEVTNIYQGNNSGLSFYAWISQA